EARYERNGKLMKPKKPQGLLQQMLSESMAGHGFLWVCLLLALAGTFSAAYPVTAVVVPASLLAPGRWRQIAVTTALGSALGATLLVIVCHHLGWSQVYRHFPEFVGNARWGEVMAWMSRYGLLALFVIALSPLPQTPALVFAGIVRHDYADVFAVMLAGKFFKYGAYAWLTASFPERFSNGIGGFFHVRR
ncbi:MAG: VTT domain-containing protein, partial [Rugosibacter sp.]